MSFGGFQKGLARNVKVKGGAYAIYNLLKHMDGKTEFEEIIKNFSEDNKITLVESKSIATLLVLNGFIENAKPDYLSFSENEIERYDRNVKFFSRIDTSNEVNHWKLQEKLKFSRIAILGMGGIGSNVALSLISAGVGFIRIMDSDLVDISNLTRQILYTEEDLGKSKTEKALKNLSRLNSYSVIEAIEDRVESLEKMKEFVSGVDILIMAADEPREFINLWADEACRESEISWILASYASTSVNCMTFTLGFPCFQCFLHHKEQNPLANKYEESEKIFPSSHATIAPIASLPAQFAAYEAIKIITKLGASFEDIVYQINMKNMELEIFKRKFSKKCSCRSENNDN